MPPGLEKRYPEIISVFVLLGLAWSPVYAFYNWQNRDADLEMRGFLRGSIVALKNPEDTFFYQEQTDTGLSAFARLLVGGRSSENTGFELNILQTYLPDSLVAAQNSFGTPLAVERSAILEHSFSDDSYIHIVVDRINARWSGQNYDLIVGRQAINLATTFYFTPNDFFAPFAATSFYRIYKPGVDAVRAEVGLGQLSKMSLIAVSGYQSDVTTANGWSEGPDNNRTSYLGRASVTIRDMEWSILGGQVREQQLVGASLQGEWFQWLGVRAEGHTVIGHDNSDNQSNWVLGFEHRWNNGLDGRVEMFYHSIGANDVNAYNRTALSIINNNFYFARAYSAVGVGYEFTPLLSANLVTIINMIDHSLILSMSTIYSLSNESELVISMGLPYGDEPDGPVIQSEFGTYPYTLNIEARIYF